MNKMFVKIVAASFVSIPALAGHAATLEDEVRALATTMQQSLSSNTAEDPKFRSITAVGKTLLLRYQFKAKGSTISNVPHLKKDLFGKSVKTSCTDPDLAKLIERGAYLKYEYEDVNDRLVLRYEIDKETCTQSRK